MARRPGIAHTIRLHSTALVLMLVLSLVVTTAPTASAAPTLQLDVYDAEGNHLSFGQFMSVSTNDWEGWENDASYRVADGTIVELPAIFNSGGKPSFSIDEANMGISFAWPTENTGFSTLFLDNEGAGFSAGGTVNMTYQAALDYRAKLDDALARRPEFVPTATFTDLDQQATDLIDQAAGAGSESERGAFGQQALDSLAQAFEELLKEDGRQRALEAAPDHPYWWGVTVDYAGGARRVVKSISDMVNGNADSYVRIVFDPGNSPNDYDRFVNQSIAKGVIPVGQIADSSAMDFYTVGQWQDRVEEFVDHFPQIDVWEIGNEVNGSWLGDNVAEKLEYAANYVKTQDPTDTTVLTFFWAMGSAGEADYTLFQWIDDNVSPALIDDTDVVTLSMWLGGAPFGIAHDEVYERLHALFPDQMLAMGELGYFEEGTSTAWYWRSWRRPTRMRKQLAVHMYLANLSFDYSVGGVFWWYYREDMADYQPLWNAVHNVYDGIY